MLSNFSEKSPSDPAEISVLNRSDEKRFSHQEEKLDLSSSSELDHRQSKTHVPKFSIRDYVYKSRRKDLNKNWIFSDKSLQLCLKNGVQNPLPPFQTPDEMRKGLPTNQNATFPCTGKAKNSPGCVKIALFSANSKGDEVEEEEQNKSYGSDEDSIMNLQEMMVSKVCPVCKTFSSSSNTTLNAHIDQCLSVESTKKSSSSVINRKIKPRKIRLMVDIYATAKNSTLEELEIRNGRSLAAQDQAVELSMENPMSKPRNSNEGDQVEGSVYIDSNGTKLRILSGPELGNADNFHNPFKKGKIEVIQRDLKIKRNPTLKSKRHLEAGKGEEKNDMTADGSSIEPTLQSMLASMGKWPCAKRAFSSSKKTTKRKLSAPKSYGSSLECSVNRDKEDCKSEKLILPCYKRRHVENEDSIKDCDVVLSTLRKLSSWGKRRRKLVVVESQSDSSRNSMASRKSREHSQPEPELASSNSKRGETENSHLQTGTITSLSNSIETKFSKLQLSQSNSLYDSFRLEVGANSVGDDVTGRNLSELKQPHDNMINEDESDSPNFAVDSTIKLSPSHENEINSGFSVDGNGQFQELASDYLSQISDCRLDILNPMPECFASGSNLQSSQDEHISLMEKKVVIAGPSSIPSSTSVLRLMGKNLMVNKKDAISFKQWSGSNIAIDQTIHCQPPNFDFQLGGNGTRFYETEQFRPPNTLAPVYQMRSDNIISSAPQHTVGSETFLYGGGGRRLHEARPAPNILVPMTAPRMEWNNSFYYNRYHQASPAIRNANFHAQTDQGTLANTNQMARWNRFSS